MGFWRIVQLVLGVWCLLMGLFETRTLPKNPCSGRALQDEGVSWRKPRITSAGTERMPFATQTPHCERRA
jgi:hypothetical protein